MSDIVERLRSEAADATNFHGETMKRWDEIRSMVEKLKGSDLPRLMFEGLIESLAELMVEAADEIERQQSRIRELEEALTKFLACYDVVRAGWNFNGLHHALVSAQAALSSREARRAECKHLRWETTVRWEAPLIAVQNQDWHCVDCGALKPMDAAAASRANRILVKDRPHRPFVIEDDKGRPMDADTALAFLKKD